MPPFLPRHCPTPSSGLRPSPHFRDSLTDHSSPKWQSPEVSAASQSLCRGRYEMPRWTCPTGRRERPSLACGTRAASGVLGDPPIFGDMSLRRREVLDSRPPRRVACGQRRAKNPAFPGESRVTTSAGGRCMWRSGCPPAGPPASKGASAGAGSATAGISPRLTASRSSVGGRTRFSKRASSRVRAGTDQILTCRVVSSIIREPRRRHCFRCFAPSISFIFSESCSSTPWSPGR